MTDTERLQQTLEALRGCDGAFAEIAYCSAKSIYESARVERVAAVNQILMVEAKIRELSAERNEALTRRNDAQVKIETCMVIMKKCEESHADNRQILGAAE